jgi:hypothetical protein
MASDNDMMMYVLIAILAYFLLFKDKDNYKKRRQQYKPKRQSRYDLNAGEKSYSKTAAGSSTDVMAAAGSSTDVMAAAAESPYAARRRPSMEPRKSMYNLSVGENAYSNTTAGSSTTAMAAAAGSPYKVGMSDISGYKYSKPRSMYNFQNGEKMYSKTTAGSSTTAMAAAAGSPYKSGYSMIKKSSFAPSMNMGLNGTLQNGMKGAAPFNSNYMRKY